MVPDLTSWPSLPTCLRQLLLDNGASVDFRDSDGRNALSLALELESNEAADVLERWGTQTMGNFTTDSSHMSLIMSTRGEWDVRGV